MSDHTEAVVLFHIDDCDRWRLTINSVRDLLEQAEPDIRVEIVVNGDAIEGVRRTSDNAARIAGLLESGVRLVLCRTSLDLHKIADTEVIAGADFVPSGMVYLARRQWGHAAYIKP